MKVTIESAGQRVTLEGVECSVWAGVTEGGSPVALLVKALAFDPEGMSAAEVLELECIWPADSSTTTRVGTPAPLSALVEYASQLDPSRN